jgi:superfamily II DNA or RNA helicase
MTTAKIYLKDEVYCTIVGLSNADNLTLFNEFAVEIEGAFFHPAVKLGRWDGKVRFFERTGHTYIRLLENIVPFLVGWGYEIELVDERTPSNVPKTRATSDMFSHMIGYRDKPVEVRPYQVEAVNVLVEQGSGFVIAGTGAGKSLITCALSEIYGREGYKTITIVPSSDLVTQTADTFRMCGMDVGEYSGDKKEMDRQHVVATWQSLQNNPHIMKLFQVVIVDEAHGAKADVIKRLINDHGQHIAYRFGVTGTFPKPEIDRFNLVCSIGRVLKTITSKWLIENGYLAEVEIELAMTSENADLPDYTAEKGFLARSEERLEYLAGMVQENMERFGNTLVLVNSIQFGRKLAKLIPGSVFLSGESKNDLRQEHYKEFNDRDDVIVIATSGIASTGISIDRIFCLFLIDAGKSFIKAIQSIGRGLRRAEDKNKVYVVDVFSSLKYSKKHSKERIKWYTEAGYPMTKVKKIVY